MFRLTSAVVIFDKIGAQLVDIRALLADDDARTRGMNGDARLLGRAFDDDLGDAGGLAERFFRYSRMLEILMQQRAVIPCSRTSGCPMCG